MGAYVVIMPDKFYSHVICLGTKIWAKGHNKTLLFYSHVICLGTKIHDTNYLGSESFTVT